MERKELQARADLFASAVLTLPKDERVGWVLNLLENLDAEMEEDDGNEFIASVAKSCITRLCHGRW